MMAFKKLRVGISTAWILAIISSVGVLSGLIFLKSSLSAQDLYTFSGTFTDASGVPLANMSVDLRAYINNNYQYSSATTNSSGQFSMSVIPGVYAIKISGSTGGIYVSTDYAAANIDLTGGNVNQDLQLQTVNVKVTVQDDNGNPVPGAQVKSSAASGTIKLYSSDPGQPIVNAMTSPVTTNNLGVANITSVVGLNYGPTNSSVGDGSICAQVNGSLLCLSSTVNVVANTDVLLRADVSPPIISNPSVSPGIVIGNYNLNISANVTDNFSGVAFGEYYIDTDPGVGKGTVMQLSSGRLSAVKDVRGSTVGQHTIFIRAKDMRGNWSTPVSTNFIYIF